MKSSFDLFWLKTKYNKIYFATQSILQFQYNPENESTNVYEALFLLRQFLFCVPSTLYTNEAIRKMYLFYEYV